MAVQIKTKLDGVISGLNLLIHEKESIARSMLVAGGQLLRDEAKARAPVDDGTLRDSMYLVYKDKKATDSRTVYSVSWNKRKAPHGHLIEFGHWRTHTAYQGKDGSWYSGAKLGIPVWVEAKPFLRPAYESSLTRVKEAMINRGKEKLAEILSKKAAVPESSFNDS